jgi:phage protein U
LGLGRIGPGGDATATLTVALTGVIWPDWFGWTRSELTLDVTAEARARQAGNTAYAGLFKLEVGHAQSVFLLANGGDAPGLARLRCTRQMSAARTLGPSVGESVAIGTITLERTDDGTRQTFCDAAPNTTDADKQEETAVVCLGPHTTIGVYLDGAAGARAQPTTWEESAYQARAHLSVVFEQDQPDFSRYPACTKGPGGSSIQILPRGVSPIVGDPTGQPGGLPARRP